jgi:hypothetical protein
VPQLNVNLQDWSVQRENYLLLTLELRRPNLFELFLERHLGCVERVLRFPRGKCLCCFALLHTKKSFLIMDKVSERSTSYAVMQLCKSAVVTGIFSGTRGSEYYAVGLNN